MAKIAYGPKVVGELAAKRQKKAAKKVRYGPRVSKEMQPESVEDEGGHDPAEPMNRAEREPTKGTPALVKDPPPKPPEPAMSDADFDELLAAHAGENGYVSIEEMKSALDEAPSAFNRLMAWELGREDGPRVGALSHLLEVEQKREGGPRSTVLGALEQGLKDARKPAPAAADSTAGD